MTSSPTLEPFRRLLFTPLAAVSLLLCVAVCALWVRSLFVVDQIASATLSGPASAVRSVGGAVYLERRSRWQYSGGVTWERRRVGMFETHQNFYYGNPDGSGGSGASAAWGSARALRLRPPRDAGALPGMRRGCDASRDMIVGAPRRRVAHHLFTVYCIASLVLCVSAAKLWLFTWSTPLGYSSGGADATYFVESAGGGVRFISQRATPTSSGNLRPNTSRLDVVSVTMGTTQLAGFIETPNRRGMAFGFGFRRRTNGWFMPPGSAGAVGGPRPDAVFTFTYTAVTVPYWFVMLAAAVPPLLGRRVLRRRRLRRERGQCRNCGYDLRASLERCPECGTVPAPA